MLLGSVIMATSFILPLQAGQRHLDATAALPAPAPCTTPAPRSRACRRPARRPRPLRGRPGRDAEPALEELASDVAELDQVDCDGHELAGA
ncbi:hypothetical protein [Sorangium sp. So ce381]|uniref:hypothetical protein n=1 Tax=Sorangium sp. So ce381 TaxID=3133307 RepID=UPI003F5CA1AE